MSGDALSCSACGYENVVAGCGFCLQCGAEFASPTAAESEPPEYQAALAAAEKLAEAEAKASAGKVPRAVAIPNVEARVATAVDKSVARNAAEANPESSDIMSPPTRVEAAPMGGTMDFQTAMDSAEQWDFQNGHTYEDHGDESLVGGTADVSPPSADDFPDEATNESNADDQGPKEVEVVPGVPSAQPSISESQSAPAAAPDVPIDQQQGASAQDRRRQPPPGDRRQQAAAGNEPTVLPAEHEVNPASVESDAKTPTTQDERTNAAAETVSPEYEEEPDAAESSQVHEAQPLDDEFEVANEVEAVATTEATSETNKEPESTPLADDDERPSFSVGLARELHAAILAAVESAGMRLREEDDRLVAQMVIDGRPQPVFIERTFTSDDTPILSFYAVCGPASPANALPLLEWNRALALCAFAVREIHRKRMFVIQANLLAYSLDIMTLRKTLIEIAKRANQVNERLI